MIKQLERMDYERKARFTNAISNSSKSASPKSQSYRTRRVNVPMRVFKPTYVHVTSIIFLSRILKLCNEVKIRYVTKVSTSIARLVTCDSREVESRPLRVVRPTLQLYHVHEKGKYASCAQMDTAGRTVSR